jgi:hypothetical protein
MRDRESIHCSGCDECNVDFNAKSTSYHKPIGLARGCAGAILEKVADAGGSGNFPDDVSPFMIGLALGRILPNCTVNREEENGYYLQELLRGLVR